MSIWNTLYIIPPNSTVTYQWKGRSIINSLCVYLTAVTCLIFQTTFIFQGMILKINEVKGLHKVIKTGLGCTSLAGMNPSQSGYGPGSHFPCTKLMDGEPFHIAWLHSPSVLCTRNHTYKGRSTCAVPMAFAKTSCFQRKFPCDKITLKRWKSEQ